MAESAAYLANIVTDHELLDLVSYQFANGEVTILLTKKSPLPFHGWRHVPSGALVSQQEWLSI